MYSYARCQQAEGSEKNVCIFQEYSERNEETERKLGKKKILPTKDVQKSAGSNLSILFHFVPKCSRQTV